MTEPSDMLRGRRVVVVTSSLTRGYNALWDAVEPDVAALAVVGARPPDDDLEVAPPDTRVPLRSVDLGRGLVYEHLFGLRRFLRGGDDVAGEFRRSAPEEGRCRVAVGCAVPPR